MPDGVPYRINPYTVMEDAPSLQTETPIMPVESPVVSKQDNSYSGVKFGTAFADARRKGLKTFKWYNPKTKREMEYTTQLKEEVQRKENNVRPMNTYKSNVQPMNTYGRETKPPFHQTKILDVNDVSNSDPIRAMNTYGDEQNMSGFEFDGNIPLPPTMQNRPGQREFSNSLANDIVATMGTTAATMGLGALLGAITKGSKGMINAYQLANTSRKGLAPGMKALKYEVGTGQIPVNANVERMVQMMGDATAKGRAMLEQKQLLDFLNKTIKYGQSLK